MKRLSLALALLAASPAAAAPTVLLCAFDSARSDGWIAPAIQITHDAATGRVEVLDPIILEHGGAPIAGSARSGGDGTVTYSWFLRNFRSGNGHLVARLSYRVTVRTADGTAMGRMEPAGFLGTFSAPGECRSQG